MEILLDL